MVVCAPVLTIRKNRRAALANRRRLPRDAFCGSESTGMPTTDWEREAENWVRWARAPGHDAYWYYAPSFFDQVVPKPGRRTLEIGCGEGRVARDLRQRGHHVTAVDSSSTLTRYASQADPEGNYLAADATALPFADGAFDIVVAYNSLIDVEDMPAAVAEAARVLAPTGSLCVSVTHPVSDSGAFPGDDPDAPFVIEGTYLGKRRFEATFQRDGLRMTFRGWSYSLEDYSRALESAGLLVERLREPAATDEAVTSRASYLRWRRVPMFLQFRALKG
jgi:SAM-dependent methyltransferase